MLQNIQLVIWLISSQLGAPRSSAFVNVIIACNSEAIPQRYERRISTIPHHSQKMAGLRTNRNKHIISISYTSMALCKSAVTPLLTR